MEMVKIADFISPGNDGKKRLEWNGILNFLRSTKYNQIKALTGDDILFSLGGFDFINPDGLIWLLLIGDEFKSKKNSLWLEFPRDNRQLEYFKLSKFYRVASEIFSITNLFYLDEIREIPSKRGIEFFKVSLESLGTLMRELNLFLTLDFAKKVDISQYGEIVFEHLPLFLRVIIETSKNIVQHSRERENMGWGYFMMSQVRNDLLRFCIVDAGRGYSSSLKTKGIKTKDDFDAIYHALLFRYYEREGEGLFRVVQFISQLNGIIRIRSGRNEVFLDTSKNILSGDEETKNFIQQNLRKGKSDFYFPGVQIQIDVKRQ